MNALQLLMDTDTTRFNSKDQGWGKYWIYEYEHWKISARVLVCNVFSTFMFIILGKTST